MNFSQKICFSKFCSLRRMMPSEQLHWLFKWRRPVGSCVHVNRIQRRRSQPPFPHIYEQMRALIRTSNVIMLKIISNFATYDFPSVHSPRRDFIIFNPTHSEYREIEFRSYHRQCKREIICCQMWASPPPILCKFIDAAMPHRRSSYCRCSWKNLCAVFQRPTTMHDSIFTVCQEGESSGIVLKKIKKIE